MAIAVILIISFVVLVMILGMRYDKGTEKSGFITSISEISRTPMNNSTYWDITLRIDTVYGPDIAGMDRYHMKAHVSYSYNDTEFDLTLGIDDYSDDVFDPGLDGLLGLRVCYIDQTGGTGSIDEGDLIRVTGLPGSSDYIRLTFSIRGEEVGWRTISLTDV